MSRHDGAGDRQSQSCTVTFWMGPRFVNAKEPIKQARQHFRADAWATVGYSHLDAFSRLNFNGYNRTSRSMAQCIGEKIAQRPSAASIYHH